MERPGSIANETEFREWLALALESERGRLSEVAAQRDAVPRTSSKDLESSRTGESA
jgi:hypothetical protein